MTDELRQDLETLINHYSLENRSDTPDFILAQYLLDCLEAFDRATRQRNSWYSAPAEKAQDNILPTHVE